MGNHQFRFMYNQMFPNATNTGYQLPGTIDFWHEPLNVYYARLDKQGDAIIPNTTRIKEIRPFGSGNAVSKTPPMYVLDFVANAFNHFQAYMNHGPPAQKIKGSPWEKVIPVKAWSGNVDSYNTYINILASSFIDRYLHHHKHSTEVFNVKDFVRVFFAAADKIFSGLPLTRSAYTLSKRYGILDTGTCIELSEDSHSEDFLKFDKWVKDPSFDYFRYEAAKHGFLIDKNAPWRLVMNLNSPVLNKVLPSDVTSDNLFDIYFHKTYLTDAQELKNNLFHIYNAFAQKFPFEMIPCSMLATTKVTREDRFTVSYEEYNELFDDLFWLEKYFTIRVFEESTFFTKEDFNRHKKNVRLINKFIDKDAALDYINKCVNVTNTIFSSWEDGYVAARQRKGTTPPYFELRADQHTPSPRPGRISRPPWQRPTRSKISPELPDKKDWLL